MGGTLNDAVENPRYTVGFCGGKEYRYFDLTKIRATHPNAGLNWSNWDNENLRDAINSCGALVDLSGSHLRSVSLNGANLAGANLSNANLCEASLNGADLTMANLSYSVMFQAGLKGAKLLGAQMVKTHLGNADLREADLSWANLQGANLESYLCYFNLWGEKMQGENLRGAKMKGTNLQDAEFTAIWKQLTVEQALGARKLRPDQRDLVYQHNTWLPALTTQISNGLEWVNQRHPEFFYGR
jgi:uncharacterized protein YjbI with pentapeptide repeats